MGFHEDICVLVTCDACTADPGSTGARTTRTTHETRTTEPDPVWVWGMGGRHFPDYDTARSWLVEQGWQVTTDPAGGGVRLICPGCAGLADCARRGHVWGPWQPRDLRLATLAGTSRAWHGHVRACTACPDTEWNPPLLPTPDAAPRKGALR